MTLRKISLVNYTFYPLLNSGVATLISSLKVAGFEVTLIDIAFQKRKNALGSILTALKKHSPDIVVIYVFPLLPAGIDIREQLREAIGNIPILIGGLPPPLSEGGCVIECKGQNVWTFAGDASHAMVEFITEFERGHSVLPLHVPAETPDIDSLPVPDYTDFDMPRYLKATPVLEGHIPVLASKGCPYPCSYCINRQKPIIHRKPHLVLEEIKIQEKRHRKHGMKSFGFCDSTFGMPRKEFRTMMGLFTTDRLGGRLTWMCQTRPELVSKDWANAAARGGCQVVLLGLESGDERIRRTVLNKGFSNSQFERAVRNLREAGIECEITILTSVPGTSAIDNLRSFIYATSLRPNRIYPCSYQPYAGTPLGDAFFKRYENQDGPEYCRREGGFNRMLKACSIAYAILRGLQRYRGAYTRDLFSYLLNKEGCRVLPLNHQLTAELLFSRPLSRLGGENPQDNSTRRKRL